jgi:diacylglycerol O-acyltransferase / wax synthase
VVAGARQAARAGLDILRHPGVLREATTAAGGFGRALNRLVTMYPDNRTVLKGTLSGTKRTSWIDPIPLDAVREVGRATGSTVNDVLVAVAAGAIGRYLEERPDARSVDRIRAMVPFNLRALDEEPSLGNGFGLVILGLPVGTDDPLDRLSRVREEMQTLKDSPEAVLVLGILRFTGMSPIQVQNTIVRFFGTKTSLVLTNVRGPDARLYFAGSRIDHPMFWVPQSGGMGIGISILSYAGGVHVGVISDAALVPDPDRVTGNFTEDFAALHGAVTRTGTARCTGITRAGTRCRNRAPAGSDRCRVHSTG